MAETEAGKKAGDVVTSILEAVRLGQPIVLVAVRGIPEGHETNAMLVVNRVDVRETGVLFGLAIDTVVTLMKTAAETAGAAGGAAQFVAGYIHGQQIAPKDAIRGCAMIRRSKPPGT